MIHLKKLDKVFKQSRLDGELQVMDPSRIAVVPGGLLHATQNVIKVLIR